MLYFLIIVVPFIAVMGYLVRRNNQVRHYFGILLDRTIEIGRRESNFPTEDLSDLHKEYVITNSSIKKLEMVIHELEIFYGLKKSRTIANVFASRVAKLNELEKKLIHLKEHSHQELKGV